MIMMAMVITVLLLAQAVYIPDIRLNRNYNFQRISQKVKDQDRNGVNLSLDLQKVGLSAEYISG